MVGNLKLDLLMEGKLLITSNIYVHVYNFPEKIDSCMSADVIYYRTFIPFTKIIYLYFIPIEKLN